MTRGSTTNNGYQVLHISQVNLTDTHMGNKYLQYYFWKQGLLGNYHSG